MENSIKQNPKSYWVWLHREWITARMKVDWQRELMLCHKLLELDERNFHCWNYRRYVTSKADLPLQKDIEFTTAKIEKNFSNYSAWHQRSAAFTQMYKSDTGGFIKKLDEEFEYVQNAFYTEPSDQSIWIYHRWLIDKSCELLSQDTEARNKVLNRELKMCGELIQLEPNSKWPLHTGMYLMTKLGTINFMNQIQTNLEMLINIDPDRHEYYKSLLKKFTDNNK